MAADAGVSDVDAGATGRERIVFPQDPFAGLPRDDGGRPVVMSGAAVGVGFTLIADPTLKDPITAKGRCLDSVVRCLNDSPTSDAAAKACVARAPTCQTVTPWLEPTCCPLACKEAFANAADSLGVRSALIRYIAVGHGCYPGLANFLDGGL